MCVVLSINKHDPELESELFQASHIQADCLSFSPSLFQATALAGGGHELEPELEGD